MFVWNINWKNLTHSQFKIVLFRVVAIWRNFIFTITILGSSWFNETVLKGICISVKKQYETNYSVWASGFCHHIEDTVLFRDKTDPTCKLIYREEGSNKASKICIIEPEIVVMIDDTLDPKAKWKRIENPNKTKNSSPVYKQKPNYWL